MIFWSPSMLQYSHGGRPKTRPEKRKFNYKHWKIRKEGTGFFDVWIGRKGNDEMRFNDLDILKEKINRYEKAGKIRRSLIILTSKVI